MFNMFYLKYRLGIKIIFQPTKNNGILAKIMENRRI